MNRSYESHKRTSTPPPRSPASRFGARLSPRRKLYAERLLNYILDHSGKILVDEGVYADLREDRGIDRYGAHQALDDLYALGLIDLRMVGEMQVAQALARSIEEAA